MLPQQPFWYLRHGETDWNARNLSQGTIDIPLNATGIEQTRVAAERVRDIGIRSIVSSPLSRARDTAAAVASTTGLPVSIEPELVEVRFGVEEGQPMGTWYDSWIAGAFTPEGAEPFAELRARAVRAIARALEQSHPVLIVAHGALFRAVRAEMNLVPNVRTPNATPILCEPGPTPDAPWTLTPHT